MNVIKERANRILTQDKAYRAEEVKYLLSVMKGMPQEELIRHLYTLSLPEIKAVVSCGVPGHANIIAKQILKEKKDALELIIQEGGIEAVIEPPVEINEEEKDDNSEGVRPSEKRREGDSGEMGEESSAAGQT